VLAAVRFNALVDVISAPDALPLTGVGVADVWRTEARNAPGVRGRSISLGSPQGFHENCDIDLNMLFAQMDLDLEGVAESMVAGSIS